MLKASLCALAQISDISSFDIPDSESFFHVPDVYLYIRLSEVLNHESPSTATPAGSFDEAPQYFLYSVSSMTDILAVCTGASLSDAVTVMES